MRKDMKTDRPSALGRLCRKFCGHPAAGRDVHRHLTDLSDHDLIDIGYRRETLLPSRKPGHTASGGDAIAQTALWQVWR